MKKTSLFWQCIFVVLIIPVLACSSLARPQVTPTPTKTPKRVKISPQALTTPTPTVALLPTVTPALVDTPTPAPPTETPVPEVPTDTPTPEPPPTDTPPPPTAPPPPPPTNTPAPPPPTQPPANEGPQVIVELPKGNTYNPGEEVKIIFVVRDPDGVVSFTWGIFMQNQSPLVGGEKICGGATECREEISQDAPLTGTYLVGADAVDTKGATSRGVGEIYVP